MVVYPEQVWYGGVTVDDVTEIVEKHLVGGEPVTRLLMTEDVARLLASVRGETASQTAEGCLREALAASGGAIRDDIAVLVAQVGLAVVSTAGRTAAGESSTRGE